MLDPTHSFDDTTPHHQTKQNHSNSQNFNNQTKIQNNLFHQEINMYSPPNDHVHILDPVTTPDHDLHSFDSDLLQGNGQFYYYRGWNNTGVSPGPGNSRAEAIARGQWELMEMVKNMPESSYELSLKDLVEQQQQGVLESSQEECLIRDQDHRDRDEKPVVIHERSVKRQESNSKNNSKKTGQMGRNGSMENRGQQSVFLKMFFPIPLRSDNSNLNNSNRKKKNSLSSSSSTKIVDKDWWKKKRSRGSRESDSSNTTAITSSDGSSSTTSSRSNSNGSNSNNRRRGFFTSCWPSFSFRKSKSTERQK